MTQTITDLKYILRNFRDLDHIFSNFSDEIEDKNMILRGGIKDCQMCHKYIDNNKNNIDNNSDKNIGNMTNLRYTK